VTAHLPVETGVAEEKINPDFALDDLREIALMPFAYIAVRISGR
jgi:hypothetical protein